MSGGRKCRREVSARWFGNRQSLVVSRWSLARTHCTTTLHDWLRAGLTRNARVGRAPARRQVAARQSALRLATTHNSCFRSNADTASWRQLLKPSFARLQTRRLPLRERTADGSGRPPFHGNVIMSGRAALDSAVANGGAFSRTDRHARSSSGVFLVYHPADFRFAGAAEQSSRSQSSRLSPVAAHSE